MNGNSVRWWYRVALSLLAVTAFLPLIQFSDGRVVTLMAPNFAAITLTSVITMALFFLMLASTAIAVEVERYSLARVGGALLLFTISIGFLVTYAVLLSAPVSFAPRLGFGWWVINVAVALLIWAMHISSDNKRVSTTHVEIK
ncbi:hypothetical protein BM525_20465 (plasmid) [Alteromonas mediterranea]|uniref:Uncharacterized protein n=1 Tax=Alteromonas mediterranea TaxID=314275 RepID=A0AAC9NTU7_9ALTE|nr:hypothetical protein [Alteromonas mediterranea]APD92254.1 hypothetical protein BM524_20270 [Alteromonas mediterranea]APE00109.1 hypothetical protein BM525_20465 [Alteromonas mediterranea]